MKLLLDILQGLGVASATGLRPFLPAILTGALATADLGVDFDGTSFAFLESPIWLLILVIALVASIFVRKLLESPPGEAALSGIGIGLGALLCAGSIDDRHATWWYGLIAGAAAALLASAVSRSLFGRVRARFAASGDNSAAAALPFYGEITGAVVAGASILFPPLAILAIGFLIALWWTGRRRGEQKYAGLRILR
jgi:Flp pilus assembly pilin Flp